MVECGLVLFEFWAGFGFREEADEEVGKRSKYKEDYQVDDKQFNFTHGTSLYSIRWRLTCQPWV